MTKGNIKKGIKKEAASILPYNCFWVNNGPILSDLSELYDALKNEVTPEQFSHHVTEEGNDFADWVENTLKDKECASQMRKVKKQSTTAEKVKNCLNTYKKQ